MSQPDLVFNAHDISRIWQLALATYDSEAEDSDLRSFFAEALHTYMEFMEDIGNGSIEFEEADGTRYVSSREVNSQGDTLRFRPVTD